jgi:hypothetical protein
MLFLHRGSSFIKNAFSRYYTSCNKKCVEDDNLFSTTMKVTFFNILLTGYINNCLIHMHYNQQNFEKNLNKKLDAEFAKLQPKK